MRVRCFGREARFESMSVRKVNHIMSTTSLKKMAADPNIHGVKKNDLFRVDPRLLVEEEGFNLRDYDAPDTKASIEAFKDSYMQGLYVPALVVYINDDGQVVIVEGHKRRRGALLAIEAGAEIAYLDCVQFRGNAAERTALMLRSGEGQQFEPLQIAMGVLRLHRWGLTNAEIGSRIGGKTASNVEQLLLLAMANPDVHGLVRSGAVSAYTAIDAVREHGERAGDILKGHLETALAQGKSKVTKKQIQGWTPPRKIVTGLVSSVNTFTSALDNKTRQDLVRYEKLSGDELQDKTVEVSAAALLELLRVHGEMTDAKKKHDDSANQKAKAKSQGKLEV